MQEYDIVIAHSVYTALDALFDYFTHGRPKAPEIAEQIFHAYEQAIHTLRYSPEAYQVISHPLLAGYGYRRIRIGAYRYYLLYRLETQTVYVDALFHELQDIDQILQK